MPENRLPDNESGNTFARNGDDLLQRLSSTAATLTFFVLLAAGLVCLTTASVYLYRFQSHTEEIKSGFQTGTGSVNGYFDITKLQVSAISIAYQSRIELLSTGVYVGLALAFLGFALIVIGVHGDISGSASRGDTKVSLSHLSPGVFVIVCSATLIAICTTRSLPLDISSSGARMPELLPPRGTDGPVAPRPSEENEQRLLGNQKQQETHESNMKSVTKADQIWDSMNQFAKRGFDLMAKEAEETSDARKAELWEQRTSAFHSAEEKLIDWVRENSVPPYSQQGLPPRLQLEIDFRGALYEEYSGDYYDARNLFSQCRENTSLQDPTATWNGTPISALVPQHFEEMVTEAQGLQSQIMSLHTSMAQSYGSPDGTEEERYEYLHKAQKNQRAWQNDSASAASLIRDRAKTTLRNDSSRVILNDTAQTTAR
jgi:hypothetical protein